MNAPTRNTAGIKLDELLAIAFVLVCASVSPLMFVVSAAGYSNMNWLGLHTLLPAAAVMALLALVGRMQGWSRLWPAVKTALWAGILATIALEVVRIIGFRFFDTMPGSMPMLMGVLLTNHFMEGPAWWTNVLGWADHFWNGFSFVLIFILLFGKRSIPLTIAYLLTIGTIFQISPVMSITGAGMFGQQVAPLGFPLTVYFAHIAFGTTMGLCLKWAGIKPTTLWTDMLNALRPRQPVPTS